MIKRLASVICAAALALAGCGPSGPDPDDLPYGTMQQFMADEVEPAAETYWNAIRYVSDEDGFHEYEPETDAEWEQVRAAAAKLGDFGEVMKGEGYSYQRGADWQDFAQRLVDVAARAERAAMDRDVDAVFKIGGSVYSACSACHQIYPPMDLEEGEAADKPLMGNAARLDERAMTGRTVKNANPT